MEDGSPGNLSYADERVNAEFSVPAPAHPSRFLERRGHAEKRKAGQEARPLLYEVGCGGQIPHGGTGDPASAGL